MEEKKALIVDFDLSGLRLGMTVYHPNVGFGREPVKLYGVRVSAKGDTVWVGLRCADGSCLWEDIGGLSIIPDFDNLCDARDWHWRQIVSFCVLRRLALLLFRRWLNHSFMPFTKRNQELYEKVREKYDSIKRK